MRPTFVIVEMLAGLAIVALLYFRPERWQGGLHADSAVSRLRGGPLTMDAVKRVVAATDFSDSAGRALPVAVRLAKLMGAMIDLVHVHPMSSSSVISPVPGIVPPALPTPEVMQTIDQNLAALSATVRDTGVRSLSTSLAGDAADEVTSYARRIGADLIVVGTHGRTGLRRVLLGSVAEKILRQAHCPVVVVPSQDAGLA